MTAADLDDFHKWETRQDAKDRAWRTFLQNVGLDIGVTVGPLLVDAFTRWDGAFTRAYWLPVGISVSKTAVLVVLAYIMRMKKPPKNGY